MKDIIIILSYGKKIFLPLCLSQFAPVHPVGHSQKYVSMLGISSHGALLWHGLDAQSKI